jgi:DNA-binding PadR family transcriptional regulator
MPQARQLLPPILRLLGSINPATLTNRLKKLEQAKLITRTEESRADVTHSLTPLGKEAIPLLAALDTFANKTIEQLETERNRIANDYDAACYNYQLLYDAYDALYVKTGAEAGHEKISRPGGARGYQDLCYR